MKLENNFTIDAPVEKAWEALNSPETVAPCFPGATLTSYEGDRFTGTVKVKLGPIAMTYKGTGTYVARDDAAHRVVIDATGRDSRGNGTASAKVTASLAAEGADRTAVSLVTDMTITGKPAQFGRGVISDVADKIIGQFSACVARKLADPGAGSTEGSAAAAAGSVGAAQERAGAAQERAASVAAPAASVPASTSASTSGEKAATTRPSAAVTAAGMPAGAPGAKEMAGAVSERSTATNGKADASTDTATAGTASAGTASAGTASAGTASAGTASAGTPAAAPSTPSSPAAPARAPLRGPVQSEVEAIDLLDTAGAPVLKRAVPAAGGAALLLLVVLLVRRLRSGRPARVRPSRRPARRRTAVAATVRGRRR